MRKIRIGIDVDNVIVDFSEQFVIEFNKVTGKNIIRDDITEWSVTELFSNLYDDVDEALVLDILNRPSIALEAPYKESARETLIKMSKNKNIEIVIITALHDELIEYRKFWFKKEFPNLNYELHFEQNKSNVHLNNPIDYIIDDGLHNLDNLSKYIAKENCICIEEPYNINSEYPTVKTLEEAYNYILQKENI